MRPAHSSHAACRTRRRRLRLPERGPRRDSQSEMLPAAHRPFAVHDNGPRVETSERPGHRVTARSPATSKSRPGSVIAARCMASRIELRGCSRQFLRLRADTRSVISKKVRLSQCCRPLCELTPV
ncbi:uncharacterized protein LOC142817834 [Rhipicephalus microplus]|uniref:uncharacterized protein LOC142817834 n=1 Tax=Rhipicephalus microplus TaxID=6941 RepID=UPI003F6A59E7